MAMTKLCAVTGLITLVGTMTGCGDRTEFPETAKVTGNITFNGAAVAGASVTFSPTRAGGHAAFGTTDAQGKYELSTFGIKDGAVPSIYKVTVSKMLQAAQGDEGSTAENPSAAYERAEALGIDVMGTASGDAGAGAKQAEELLPVKYKMRDASPFEANVTADGGDFPFDLTTD